MLTAKQATIALLLTIPFYFASAPFVLANADSLVIADDGEVVLRFVAVAPMLHWRVKTR